MTRPDADTIDRIVGEVLARLGGFTPSDAASSGSIASSSSDAASSPVNTSAGRSANVAPRAGELVVSSRVVSLAALHDRLQGVRRLVVLPGAVVTPSVRDELRRRNIGMTFGRPVTAPVQGGTRVLVMVHGSGFAPKMLENALVSEGFEVSADRAECLIAATDAMAREVDKPDTVVLLVTTHAPVAVCLANRHASARAMPGIDPGRLAADAASLGANVLVLDPRSLGPFTLKQMAIAFCRQGPFACPESLRERLVKDSKPQNRKPR